MVDLLELAARVEALTGPDRELDANIHYDVLGWCRHTNTKRSGAQSDTGFDCLDCGADSWGNKSKRGQKLHDVLPAYTASLDAAMTLVPTTAPWTPYRDTKDLYNIVIASAYGHVNIMPTDGASTGIHDKRRGEASAATLPLALTAAALRACASQGKSG